MEVDLRLRRFMGITGVTKSGVEEEFDESIFEIGESPAPLASFNAKR